MARTVGIAEFKAKCVGLIKETRRTGTGLVITLRGRPVARLEPVDEDTSEKQLGRLATATRLHGDIALFDFSDDWEAGR